MPRSKQIDTLRDEAMLFLSLAFFVAYAVPIAWPDVSVDAKLLCERVQLTTWIAFGVDYLLRLVSAKGGRRRFIFANWLDLVILAVPALRTLRLLRAASAAAFIARSFPRSTSFRLSLSMKLAATCLVVWLLAGLAVTEAERGAEGAIQSVGQGLWWAITTMATVGYGDLYPVTVEGRLIGGSLMVMGIVIFSIVTGTAATWVLERMRDTEQEIEEQTHEIARLREEITLLREALEMPSKQHYRNSTENG